MCACYYVIQVLSGLSSFVKVDKLTKVRDSSREEGGVFLAIEEWRRQAEEDDPTVEAYSVYVCPVAYMYLSVFMSFSGIVVCLSVLTDHVHTSHI